jgi:hypothetical protein
MTNAILEEKLFFAQASLTAATRNNEQQESEHKNLWQQLQQSLRDQERLERALKDSRQRNTSHRDREGDSVRDRDSGFGPVSQAGGDEFNRLSERLVQVPHSACVACLIQDLSALFCYFVLRLPYTTHALLSSFILPWYCTTLYCTALHCTSPLFVALR